MKNKLDVSIIIVNYKTPYLVKDCIQSIYDNTMEVSFEIIVVDNDSNDDCKIILERAFPLVKFIEAESNLGFGKANNLGVTHSIGKYVFLLP